MSVRMTPNRIDPADGRAQRRQWLERFAAVSKEVLRSHWQETIETAEYAHLSQADAAELLVAMEWVVDAFTQCLEEERRFSDEELAGFRALGTRRAQQGIQLEGLKESFRRGVEQCSAEFTDIAFRTSGLQAGQTLTSLILQELLPLAAAAEDEFTAGYSEGRGLPEAAALGLTQQELRVLRLLPGLTNHQISTLLERSPETVKTQVSRILVKLGAHDRAHAVAIGMSHGLIPNRFAAWRTARVTRQRSRACAEKEGDGKSLELR